MSAITCGKMSTQFIRVMLSKYLVVRGCNLDIAVRSIGTSNNLFKGKSKHVNNVRKTEKLMQKFSEETARKKRKWFSGSMHAVNEGSTSTGKKYKQENTRRLRQLGVILYDHITSVINSGEIDPKLVGVEISKVAMVPDFSAVLVHWIVSGVKEKDDITQERLEMNAKRIRAFLINMHVMGNVPNIHFVKDKTHSRADEIEYLLKKADLGPDFLPSTTVQHSVTLPSMPSLQELSDRYWSTDYESVKATNTIQEITNQVHDLDLKVNKTLSENENFSSDELMSKEKELTNLKSDIYGLDQVSLSDSILHTKRKIKNRNYEINSETEKLRLSLDTDAGDRTIDVNKFLNKKKMDMKNNRVIQRYDARKFYLENIEMRKRMEDFHQDEVEEEDYIEEHLYDFHDMNDYMAEDNTEGVK